MSSRVTPAVSAGVGAAPSSRRDEPHVAFGQTDATGPVSAVPDGKLATIPIRTFQGHQSGYLAVKRLLDIVGALLLVSVLAPVLLVLALLIQCTSPGGVIFKQTRVGKDLRPFTCDKFRTMVDNAEWILRTNHELHSAYAVNWKLARDPRVTRVGRFLRKTSLDELPQLFNVIKGEMSLVGPRPYLPHELEGPFGAHAIQITRVHPGMTGLWHISGRSSLGPNDRISLDLRYAQQPTFRADLLILLKTLYVVIVTRGACSLDSPLPPTQLIASRSRCAPMTIDTRRRALIVGTDYWPDVTGIAPYTTGLAEHLATLGIDVTVVAGMPSYPEWSIKAG